MWTYSCRGARSAATATARAYTGASVASAARTAVRAPASACGSGVGTCDNGWRRARQPSGGFGQTRAFSWLGFGASSGSSSDDSTSVGASDGPAGAGVDLVGAGSEVPGAGTGATLDGLEGAGSGLAERSSEVMEAWGDRLASMDGVLAEASVSALSTQSALEGAGIGPVVLMMRAVEGLHMYAGLPWWGAIMATTLAVRVCVSPLYFSGLKAGVAMRKLQPQTQALQARLKWAKSVGDNHTQQATAKELQELFKKNGVSPLKPLLGGLVQLPVFISLVWALRRINDNAADFEGWTSGGMLWFTDLTAYDPRFTLPLMGAAFNLAATQVNKNIHDSPMMSAKTMRNVLRFMSVAFVPLTAMLPAALHVSFATTAFTMFLQMSATNSRIIRRLVGLPDVWPVPLPNDPNAPPADDMPKVSLFSGPKSAPPPPPPPLPQAGTLSDTPPPPPGRVIDAQVVGESDPAAPAEPARFTAAPGSTQQSQPRLKKKKNKRRKKKRG